MMSYDSSKKNDTGKVSSGAKRGKTAVCGRIWEVDAMRGFGILCVTIVHFFSFWSSFYRPLYWPPVLYAIKQYGGSTFVFWAGLSASLAAGRGSALKNRKKASPSEGTGCFKRGLKLLAIGFVLTAVSYWLYLSGREPQTVLIQWGVLHCIGACLLLYPLVRRFPVWLKYALGAVIVAAGYWLMAEVRVEAPWLFPIGLKTSEFMSFDYFPLMPHFGWFLMGNATGILVYGRKTTSSKGAEAVGDAGLYAPDRSLFPGTDTRSPLVRFFTFCGRRSLVIYLTGFVIFYLVFSSLR